MLWSAFHCVPLLAKWQTMPLSRFFPWVDVQALIVPTPTTIFGSMVNDIQPGDCCSEVAGEDLSRPRVVASVVLAPCPPTVEQAATFDCSPGLDDAPIPQEGADRAGEVFEFLKGLPGGCGLDEVSPCGKPIAALHRPMQDAGKFGQQSFG